MSAPCRNEHLPPSRWFLWRNGKVRVRGPGADQREWLSDKITISAAVSGRISSTE